MLQPNKKIKVKKQGDIEMTRKYAESKEQMKQKVSNTEPGAPVVNDATQGIAIDKSSLKATPKRMVRSVTNSGGYVSIKGEGDKLVFKGREGSKEAKEALRTSKNKVADVNDRRDVNANLWNIDSGNKPKYTEADENSLVSRDKAVRK